MAFLCYSPGMDRNCQLVNSVGAKEDRVHGDELVSAPSQKDPYNKKV